MNPLNHRQSGASRMEIAFISLILVTVGLLAYTKYMEISTGAKGSVEAGMIEVIRNGIHDYAVGSKKAGSSALFPPFLDEAKLGQSTPHNLFFTLVTGKRIAIGGGIAVEGWIKTDKNEYTAPSGKQYVYDPETGVFDIPAGNKK